MKDDGYILITEFSWVVQPKADFAEYGMYTAYKNGDKGPSNFEPFQFFIDTAPNEPFDIF